MKSKIKSIFSNEINQIINALNANTNILVFSLDTFILETVIEEISKNFTKNNFTIFKPYSKMEITENSLFLIDISKRNLLYYYLEMCNKNNMKILFFTNQFTSIENLEKRVKSRFSNIAFVLNQLTKDQYVELFKYKLYKDVKEYKNNKGLSTVENCNGVLESKTISLLQRQYDINPTITALSNIYLKYKYSLPDYKLEDTLKYLSNIHLSILLLCYHIKIFYYNVVIEHKKFISRVKELKNTKNKEILESYEEIVDMGLVTEKGILLIDYDDLKNFICENSPQYLKKLFTYIQI